MSQAKASRSPRKHAAATLGDQRQREHAVPRRRLRSGASADLLRRRVLLRARHLLPYRLVRLQPPYSLYSRDGAELIAWRYCGRHLNSLTPPSLTLPNLRRYGRHQPDASCRRPTLTPTRYDYDHSDAEWSRLAAAGRRPPWRALPLSPSPKPNQVGDSHGAYGASVPSSEARSTGTGVTAARAPSRRAWRPRTRSTPTG